jgi:hypothetical protein
MRYPAGTASVCGVDSRIRCSNHVALSIVPFLDAEQTLSRPSFEETPRGHRALQRLIGLAAAVRLAASPEVTLTSSDLSPGRHPLRSDADDRCIIGQHPRHVLRVLDSQLPKHPASLLGPRARYELGFSPDQDVPELRPILVVFVDQQRDVPPRSDVSHSDQALGGDPLRLLIHGRVERAAVIDKADRYDVGPTLGIDRRQVRKASLLESLHQATGNHWLRAGPAAGRRSA